MTYISSSGLASELFYRDNVTAFVGPGCTEALDHVARLAGYWNRPIITGEVENAPCHVVSL